MVSHELHQALSEVKADVDLLKARTASDQNQVEKRGDLQPGSVALHAFIVISYLSGLLFNMSW